MEHGFIVDEGYGARSIAKWVAGEPQNRVWTGVEFDGQDKLNAASYRCKRCGYLESYA